MRWVVSRRRFVSSFMAADKNVDSIRAVSGGLPASPVVVVMSVGWSAYLELGALWATGPSKRPDQNVLPFSFRTPLPRPPPSPRRGAEESDDDATF